VREGRNVGLLGLDELDLLLAQLDVDGFDVGQQVLDFTATNDREDTVVLKDELESRS